MNKAYTCVLVVFSVFYLSNSAHTANLTLYIPNVINGRLMYCITKSNNLLTRCKREHLNGYVADVIRWSLCIYLFDRHPFFRIQLWCHGGNDFAG